MKRWQVTMPKMKSEQHFLKVFPQVVASTVVRNVHLMTILSPAVHEIFAKLNRGRQNHFMARERLGERYAHHPDPLHAPGV
jgi:hypothetical protein